MNGSHIEGEYGKYSLFLVLPPILTAILEVPGIVLATITDSTEARSERGIDFSIVQKEVVIGKAHSISWGEIDLSSVFSGSGSPAELSRDERAFSLFTVLAPILARIRGIEGVVSAQVTHKIEVTSGEGKVGVSITPAWVEIKVREGVEWKKVDSAVMKILRREKEINA